MKIFNLNEQVILATSISLMLFGSVVHAQDLEGEGASSSIAIEDTNLAILKYIEENRKLVEATILSTFAGQSGDSGGQLAAALSNASAEELQAAQNVNDMESLNLILGGNPSKNSDNMQRSLAKVGDLDKEYAFTPVTPCRVVDTRNTGGFFGLDEMREYFLYGTDMSAQGGANTGCDSPVGEPRGAMISMVAVPVSGGGTFTAYPADEAAPTRGSLLNYQFGEQAIVSATSVRTFYNIGQRELEVKNRFGRSHLVIDVLGYFSAPDTPAGVEYSTTGRDDSSMSATPESINSISVNMSSDGHCVVNASGYIRFDTDDAIARCAITNGGLTMPTTTDAAHMNTKANNTRLPMSLTRGFSQDAGATTYRLICEASTGDVDIYNAHITAMCSSNKH